MRSFVGEFGVWEAHGGFSLSTHLGTLGAAERRSLSLAGTWQGLALRPAARFPHISSPLCYCWRRACRCALHDALCVVTARADGRRGGEGTGQHRGGKRGALPQMAHQPCPQLDLPELVPSVPPAGTAVPLGTLTAQGWLCQELSAKAYLGAHHGGSLSL